MSFFKAVSSGSIITMKIAPRIAPCRPKAPPMMITMMNSIDSRSVNISGLMNESLWA